MVLVHPASTWGRPRARVPRLLFLKKMTICASGSQIPTHILILVYHRGASLALGAALMRAINMSIYKAIAFP